MRVNLRRLSAIAVGLAVLALGLVASATAATPEVAPPSLPQINTSAPFFKTLPTRVKAPTTRPLAIPGTQAPLVSADLAKNAQLAKKLGIPTRSVPKAMSSAAPNRVARPGDSTDAFLTYVYYSWGFAAVYDGYFVSNGITWYQQVWYFYVYNYGYYGYGLYYEYYYGGWQPYGWFCCY